jgi:hypothetical protein
MRTIVPGMTFSVSGENLRPFWLTVSVSAARLTADAAVNSAIAASGHLTDTLEGPPVRLARIVSDNDWERQANQHQANDNCVSGDAASQKGIPFVLILCGQNRIREWVSHGEFAFISYISML